MDTQNSRPHLLSVGGQGRLLEEVQAESRGTEGPGCGEGPQGSHGEKRGSSVPWSWTARAGDGFLSSPHTGIYFGDTVLG